MVGTTKPGRWNLKVRAMAEMSDYLYADDGKIHTRYSELANCTLGSIHKVLDQREGLRKRFENEDTIWGQVRHEMWAEESRRTGLIPECFWDVIPSTLEADYVEKEFATDIMPGVIVHSRPDNVSSDTVVDYKTLIAESLQIGIIKAQ